MMYIFAFARELTLGFSLIKKSIYWHSADTVLGMVSSVVWVRFYLFILYYM